MQRCLQLAKKGVGSVSPNPMVGAVLVYEDTIIGEGYHQQYGGPHAEVNCIQSVKNEHQPFLSKSKLYVSLEPCNHFGKTGPCSDFIIEHRIPEVVIACKDPFEKVSGTGIEKLRQAGIKVSLGVLENAAVQLNKRFFCFHEKKRPYIILKWAQTANKMIAHSNGHPLKISNSFTDKRVHQWRSEEAAIMVGTNTVIQDNPSLTTRWWPGKNPIRIVIDKYLKLPPDKKVFDGAASTMIFNFLEEKKVGANTFYKISPEKNLIQQILDVLHKNNVQSVLIEGGALLIQSFIDAELWDEVRVITNSKLIVEDGLCAPVLKSRQYALEECIDDDFLHYYFY